MAENNNHKHSQSLLSKFINKKKRNLRRKIFSLDSLFGSFLLLRQVLDDFFFLSQETLLSTFAGLLCL